MAFNILTEVSVSRQSSDRAVSSEAMASLFSISSRAWRAVFSRVFLAPSMTNLASSDNLFLGISYMLMMIQAGFGEVT